MKDADFQALRKGYDERGAILQTDIRRRFAGPDWDVLTSIDLAQRDIADLMYRDVYVVRMGYCGARLEKMITGQVLREARFDSVDALAKHMIAEMDQFQREHTAEP